MIDLSPNNNYDLLPLMTGRKSIEKKVAQSTKRVVIQRFNTSVVKAPGFSEASFSSKFAHEVVWRSAGIAGEQCCYVGDDVISNRPSYENDCRA